MIIHDSGLLFGPPCTFTGAASTLGSGRQPIQCSLTGEMTKSSHSVQCHGHHQHRDDLSNYGLEVFQPLS